MSHIKLKLFGCVVDHDDDDDDDGGDDEEEVYSISVYNIWKKLNLVDTK